MVSVLKTQFSFLLSGPRFTIEMPPDFTGLPILSSPLANGVGGGRSFDFVPTNLDVGIVDEIVSLGTTPDRDGRTVEVIERAGEPAQWYLRWTLVNGLLYTHLRKEDGVEMCAVTAAALSILEDENTGLPLLVPSPPLEMGDMTWPGYQESARWHSPSRPAWAIILRRPGFVRSGKVLVAGVSSEATFRARAPLGVEIQVVADNFEEGRATLDAVLASFAG
jgi:hypothetical protein